MFEKTDEVAVEETPVTPEVDPAPAPTPDPVVTPPPVSAGDYGLFNGAMITVENGMVTVLIPLANGQNITVLPVPLAAAWMVDNLAGSMLAEAKKHKV